MLPNFRDLFLALRSNFRVSAAALLFGLVGTMAAHADEKDALAILKSMSDYVGTQDAISFTYGSALEVMTQEGQRLALVSSGSVSLNRPDGFHTTRSGGFAETETFYDGKTLTILGKNRNMYVQVEAPGSFDELIEMMANNFDRSPPAADLLLSNSYDQLMQGVTDVKDLGSGVINGVECDFLAFRAEQIDWQIWVAHGDRPYPCRYVVTSKKVDGGPQYSIQISNWATGSDAVNKGFSYSNTTDAAKIDAADLGSKMSELPGHFKTGE
ncbi:MAG: DUF2092 domain-containing protein [Rhodobacteraceae bacterium]|nr:DUF2092 domain-containing protein [Paracoccaceae bacterium]